METQIQTAIPRIHVVSALTKLRQDWQNATAGRSLISVDGNVALLLVDVAMSIGLDTIEQVQVFGVELAQELDETLAPQPGRNGRH